MENLHLSAERIQAYLDGELSSWELTQVQVHADSCARCQAEIETWKVLLAELGDLPELTPSVGFADRVMAALPGRVSLGGRVRGWLPWTRPERPSRHLDPAELQDFLDGGLRPGRMQRVSAHVAGCEACRSEVAGWRALFGDLDRLARLAPPEGFREAVMARVRIRGPARHTARPTLPVRIRGLAADLVPATAPRQVAQWARRLVPRTRRAWAAAASVAAAPSVALGVLAYVVFSHPLVTPGALTSYVWWKASDAAAAWGGQLWQELLESVTAFRAFTLVEAVTGSLTGLLMFGVAMSALMAASLWILYRNLIVTPSVSSRHARTAS